MAPGLLESLSNVLKNVIILIYIVVIIVTGIFIVIMVPSTSASLELIQNVDNACLTISSISLAAILAIIAIIVTRSPAKSVKPSIFYRAIPSIGGALTALYSLLFSYSGIYDAGKNLLTLSMAFTVLSLLMLFIIFNFEKDKFFAGP